MASLLKHHASTTHMNYIVIWIKLIPAVISSYYNLNFRGLNLHFRKLITLIKTTQDNYNFVTLFEIGTNKFENREVELKCKYGLTKKYELPNSGKVV